MIGPCQLVHVQPDHKSFISYLILLKYNSRFRKQRTLLALVPPPFAFYITFTDQFTLYFLCPAAIMSKIDTIESTFDEDSTIYREEIDFDR